MWDYAQTLTLRLGGLGLRRPCVIFITTLKAQLFGKLQRTKARLTARSPVVVGEGHCITASYQALRDTC